MPSHKLRNRSCSGAVAGEPGVTQEEGHVLDWLIGIAGVGAGGQTPMPLAIWVLSAIRARHLDSAV